MLYGIESYAYIVPFVENENENFPQNCISKSEIFKTLRFEGVNLKKLSKKATEPLDKEESDLMKSLENDACKPVKDFKQQKKAAVEAARNTLKKGKRVNLRLSQKDYHRIQIKAVEEGIPYQTLISSIIHKYLNGSLSPKQK